MRLLLTASLVFFLLPAVTRGQSVVNYDAGYWLTSGGPYTSVSARTIVPTAFPYVAPGTVAAMAGYVGIGNSPSFSANGFIQVGYAVTVSPDQSFSMGAICNIFTAGGEFPCTTSSGPMHPGDVLDLSITCTAACTSLNAGTTWTFVVHDVTAGWTMTSPGVVAENLLNSAEWFIEANEVASSGAASPRYGTALWSNLSTNLGAPTLSPSGNGTKYDDGLGSTGFPSNQAGNAFNVCWGPSPTYATCDAPTATPGMGRAHL